MFGPSCGCSIGLAVSFCALVSPQRAMALTQLILLVSVATASADCATTFNEDAGKGTVVCTFERPSPNHSFQYSGLSFKMQPGGTWGCPGNTGIWSADVYCGDSYDP